MATSHTLPGRPNEPAPKPPSSSLWLKMLYRLAVAWLVVGALAMVCAAINLIALVGMFERSYRPDAPMTFIAALACVGVGLVCLTVGALLRVVVDRLAPEPARA